MDSDTQVQILTHPEEIAGPPKRGPVQRNQEQNQEYNNGKIDFEYVMFTDDSRSSILVAYFDSEGWGRIETHSAGIARGSIFSRVIDSGITVENIDEMTDLFAIREAEAQLEIEEFRRWKQAGAPTVEEIQSIELEINEVVGDSDLVTEASEPEIVTVVEEVKVEIPTISVNHMAANYSEEDLFRMKIEVFDIPSVRAASKDLKARIRKATTPVEIFAIIHEANVSFGNG